MRCGEARISLRRHRHPRDDPREDVGVRVGVAVGVVECQLEWPRVSTCSPRVVLRCLASCKRTARQRMRHVAVYCGVLQRKRRNTRHPAPRSIATQRATFDVNELLKGRRHRYRSGSSTHTLGTGGRARGLRRGPATKKLSIICTNMQF